MAISLWKNVSVAMQSAIAATKTITAITKASPAVCSATSNGYSNGDYVLLTVQGMFQVHGRVFRVTSAATDTFALEGCDSTLFDTFSSGTAQKLTFGTSITTALDWSSSGGGFDQIDTTTIHAGQKSSIPGLPAAMAFNFNSIWDPADAGLIALKTASDSQAQRAVKLTFGTGGAIVVFNGYVGCSMAPGGSAQDKVTTQVTISSTGASPTAYSS
jgi:hypothetical protein